MDRHATDPSGDGGGSRRRAVRRRIVAKSRFGTATSAVWKITHRAWRTTFAPILTSFSRKLVSDQCAPAAFTHWAPVFVTLKGGASRIS
jgi:hypothetical protein